MMELRKDIYINANRKEIQSLLDQYVETSKKIFSNHFSNNDEVVKFVNLIKNPKDAEKFLETTRKLDKYKNIQYSSIEFIILISIIEKNISSEYPDMKSFVHSDNEIVMEILKKIESSATQDSILKNLDEIFLEFGRNYGLTNSFAKFIENYVSKDNQCILLEKILFRHKNHPTQFTNRQKNISKLENISQLKGVAKMIDGYVPKCYDWKNCWVEQSYCVPEMGCLIREDSDYLKESIRKLAKLLYTMRSEIVHAASDKEIPKRNKGLLPYFMFTDIDDKAVLLEITIEQFKKIFVDALYMWFLSKQ